MVGVRSGILLEIAEGARLVQVGDEVQSEDRKLPGDDNLIEEYGEILSTIEDDLRW